MLARLEASGLTGMGGAGFPTWRKWAAVRQEPGPRVVIVNADEGEPGTIKDRYVLELRPQLLLEGLEAAMRFCETDEAYIYLREEYATARAILREAIAARGLAVELVIGAGAYICGEETAMLESMEGRRGMPRLRPPFPAQSGYLGRPTLINNVETLAHVARILRGDWTPSRLWSVSGAVAKPGCYEAPLDITTRRLVEDYAGGFTEEPGAIVPGGAASGILPPAAVDVPLTREALTEWGCGVGSAAVQVFPASYSPLRLLAETMRFFAEESCQKCTPCRIGNRAHPPRLRGARARARGDVARSGGRMARRDDADLDLRARPGGSLSGKERVRALAGALRSARPRPIARAGDRVIEFTLDGRPASAQDGELLLHAAARNGVFVPTLCHDDKLDPYGGCRMCVVGVEGSPRPLPACATRVTEGMVVSTNSQVPQLQKTLTEMLLSEHLNTDPGGRPNELVDLARELGAEAPLVLPDAKRKPYADRNRLMGYEPDTCILCNRCVRYTQEVMQCSALSLEGRGPEARIVPTWERSWLDTECELCGGCLSVCPTGAIYEKFLEGAEVEERRLEQTKTTCTFCGVGCQIDLNVDPETKRIVKVTSKPEYVSNEGDLCVKGRFSFNFVHHPDRLTEPLIRGEDGKLHPATWERALAAAADGLKGVIRRHSAQAIGVLASARLTNEENYLIQKLARIGLGTNSVHSCEAT